MVATADWTPTLDTMLEPRVHRATTTFSASNTTASEIIATITGAVEILAIEGEVTVAIGSNHTAGHIRLNDQTNTPAVTLASGTTLSSAAVGSIVSAIGTPSDALALSDNSQARVTQNNFVPLRVCKKTGATTTMDYRYTTTQTPTTGAILWKITWRPVSADGGLA